MVPEMIEIAPLSPTDFADWLPLWRGYLAFYKALVADETTKLTFARLTGSDEPMGGFIARGSDGAAVGVVHWIAHRSCWTAGDYCYLQDLFVDPGQRGNGLGRRLIKQVYAVARSRHCSRVYWLTHETNTPAMALYDQVAAKSGFLQYVHKLA
jgi:GNAT superfamily N-acetyltransferase